MEHHPDRDPEDGARTQRVVPQLPLRPKEKRKAECECG